MSVSRTETCQVGALATCCHCLGVNETSHSLVSGHVALFPSSIWFLASLMFIVGMFFIIIIVRVRNLIAVNFQGLELALGFLHICGCLFSAVHRCSSAYVSSEDLGGNVQPKSRCRNFQVASTRKVSQQVLGK